MSKGIVFNSERLKQLEAGYAAATAMPHSRDDTFTVEIEGHGKHELVIGYAYHMIEYLKSQIGQPQPVYPENREGREP